MRLGGCALVASLALAACSSCGAAGPVATAGADESEEDAGPGGPSEGLDDADAEAADEADGDTGGVAVGEGEDTSDDGAEGAAPVDPADDGGDEAGGEGEGLEGGGGLDGAAPGEEPPEMPDRALIADRLAAAMGPCEVYLNPTIDSQGDRSGFDAYLVAGFDDERAVVTSGAGQNLWSVDLQSQEWHWLGQRWIRLSYAKNSIFARRHPEFPLGLAGPGQIEFRLWDLAAGRWEDLALPGELGAQHLAVGDGMLTYTDVRPREEGQFPVGWAMVHDLADGRVQQFGPGMTSTSAGGPIATWIRADPHPSDLWIYDHRTRQARQVTDDPAWQFDPATDGQSVVWTDSRNGEYVPFQADENMDIYRLDVATGEISQVTSQSDHQALPHVAGKFVVYEDTRAGMWRPEGWNRDILNKDIWLTNVETGREFQLTFHPRSQYEPRIHERAVLFKDVRFDPGTHFPGLVWMDLDCYEHEYGVDLDAP